MEFLNENIYKAVIDYAREKNQTDIIGFLSKKMTETSINSDFEAIKQENESLSLNNIQLEKENSQLKKENLHYKKKIRSS